MTNSYIKANKVPLIILGAASIVSSRVMFVFFNDPEGPNLLVISVAAIIVFLLSFAVYFFSAPTTNLRKALLAVLVPMVITASFYFLLK